MKNVFSRLHVISTLSFLLAAPLSAEVPLTNGAWKMVKTNGFPVQRTGYEKLVYASGVKRSIFLGNLGLISPEPNESMVGYDFATNRWDVLSYGGNFQTENTADGGHSSGMLTYNPNNNTILYYCCWSGSQVIEAPMRVRWFDPLGLTSRDKQTPTKPGSYLSASAAFDVANNVYVYYNASAGTWTYNAGSNSWQNVITAGTPPPADAFHAMTYNSTDRKIYLFGGRGADYSNDIYTYDVPSKTWTKLNPVGARPSPRWQSGFAYDSKNNVFLMYGGETTGDVVLSDTWVYNPASNAWTQFNPPQPIPNSYSPPFEMLTYDSDNNAFVMVLHGEGGYTEGTLGSYYAQTWMFRYAGTGPNPGTVTANPQPATGSLNKNIEAWSKEPTLASDGSTLYTAWTELGRRFDQTSARFSHLYASQHTGSTWTRMGGAFDSLDSEFGADSESHSPSLTVVGSKPWVSWYRTDIGRGNFLHKNLYAKSWNGSAWVGGPVGPGSTAALGKHPYWVAQGASQLTSVGGTPYIAFLESDRSFWPWNKLAYVKYWNGSSWVSRGAALNKAASSSGNIADSISITSDGANPIVAWTEYTTTFTTDSVPQLYVSRWNGSSWQPLGGVVNVNNGNWAQDVAIAYWNGQPYVAWTERSQSGNNQLYVKTWNGSSWNLVGSGSLNANAGGWAYRPSVITSGTSLYLGWVEQPNVGETAKAYVKAYRNGAWTLLGGALNMDSASGSAERLSVAVLDGQPIAGWAEVKLGSARQVYVKQWNGSTWTITSGSSSTPPPSQQEAPVISSFTASPSTLTSGQSTTLSWAVTNATTVSITPGIGVVTGTSVSVSPAATTAYTITATNTVGAVTATENVVVTSNSPIPVSECGPSVTHADAVAEGPLPGKPGLYQQFKDPQFGSCVKRIGDTAALATPVGVPLYSQLAAWNADNSKIYLASKDVLDGKTYAPVGKIPVYMEAPRWSPTDPDIMYYTVDNVFYKYNLKTNVQTPIRTFNGYTGFKYDEQQEELSHDGRYTMFIGLPNYPAPTGGKIFVYDIANNVVGSTLDYIQSSGCGAAGPSWVAPAPSGKYFIINWGGGGDARYCGTEAYDFNLNYIGKVTTGHHHGDLYMDDKGVDWYVDYKHDNYVGITGPRIVKSRVPRGYDEWKAGDKTASVSLLLLDWTIGGHISCQAHRVGWCVASTYSGTAENETDGWKPFEKEIFKVYMDSTEASPHVQRLVHHRSDFINTKNNCPSFSEYWAQPHATINRDGSKVIFGSTWGANCYAEAYVADAAASSVSSPSCDLNADGSVNVQDVQIATNQVMGTTACTAAVLLQDGTCTASDIQRITNAALGGACVSGP